MIEIHPSLLLTRPPRERRDERRNHVLIFTSHIQVLANGMKCLADNRHEHCQADEDHKEDEHEEGERAQHRMGVQQFSSVELHQQHLEQHLRRLQQRRTRPDPRHK